MARSIFRVFDTTEKELLTANRYTDYKFVKAECGSCGARGRFIANLRGWRGPITKDSYRIECPKCGLKRGKATFARTALEIILEQENVNQK